MNLRSKCVANFIPSAYKDTYRCHVKSDHIRKDVGRIAGPQSGPPDPGSDLLLYRSPPATPGLGIPSNEDTELFVHIMSGGTVLYYLCYPSEPTGGVSIMPLGSRLDAAAFILGKEHMQLVRLTEPERNRIRSHFPEFFHEGD